MADPRQARESAPAAQDDLLGEAARNDGTMEGLDPRIGSDGTPRDRADAPKSGSRPAARPDPARPGEERPGEAQPGRDENQAGLVKDPDKRFSP